MAEVCVAVAGFRITDKPLASEVPQGPYQQSRPCALCCAGCASVAGPADPRSDSERSPIETRDRHAVQ